MDGWIHNAKNEKPLRIAYKMLNNKKNEIK